MQQSRGSDLLIRVGPTLDTLQDLAKETDAEAVLWNRRYEPAIVARDKRIKTALAEAGLEAVSYSAALLNEPWTVQNKSGKPFQVFTPFWKTCLNPAEPPAPLPSPRNIPSPGGWPKGVQLRQLELQPQIDWAVGMRETWTPGETGAGKQLTQFLHTALVDYSTNRTADNLPLQSTTSTEITLCFSATTTLPGTGDGFENCSKRC